MLPEAVRYLGLSDSTTDSQGSCVQAVQATVQAAGRSSNRKGRSQTEPDDQLTKYLVGCENIDYPVVLR